MFGTGSTSDPFRVNYQGGSRSVAGRAPRSSRLLPGERTLVLIGAGQSNMASSENANYVPVNAAKVDNLNIYDGGLYETRDPVLGAGVYSLGGNWMVRLADKLISASHCDRVILSSVALGSTSVFDWAPGGTMYPTLVAVNRRLAALGIAASAFLWAQGETDNVNATTQAAYQAALTAMIAGIRAHGFVAPWLIGKSTYTGGSTSPAVRAALSAVLNGADIRAGGDTDSVTAVGDRWDDVHYTAQGAGVVSTLWFNAVVAAGI